MTTNATSNSRQRGDRLDTGRTPRPADSLRLGERVAVLRERLEARADTRAAEHLRADVREARAHVRNWSPERAVSGDTAQRYARVVDQMRRDDQRPEDAACKSTFEFRRAALVHETRAELRTALRDLDRAKRGGDLERAADAYNRVRAGLETLRRYPPSTGSRERDLERSSAYRGPSRPPDELSNGKRPSLAGLPADWCDRVQAQVRDPDRPAVATMALTGCRPVEVRGIRIRHEDEHVVFEIRGAKLDEDRGVKVRTVSLDKSELEQSQAGRDLAAWLGRRECRTISYRGERRSFSGARRPRRRPRRPGAGIRLHLSACRGARPAPVRRRPERDCRPAGASQRAVAIGLRLNEEGYAFRRHPGTPPARPAP